jgi:SAM-dependent methyltransferase
MANLADQSFNPDNYWEDRLTKISGLEGVGFKKLGKPFNKWAYKIRKNVFLRILNKIQPSLSTSNVLDIGSGTGFYIQIWKELNVKSITGVDITHKSVENLKNTFKDNHFFQSDIGDIDFNKNNEYKEYDFISCMDVLFHIVDDKRFEQAVKNISKIIRNDGYFIYSDNFLHSYTIRGESQVSRSKEYLIKVFNENNFELVTIKPFMFLTNTPIDSKNPLLKIYWYLLENTLYVASFLGHLFGPLLYPIESLLVKNCNESPTTEIAVFRKRK